MTDAETARRVLFVCSHNAGRGIVATALAQRGIALTGASPKVITTELLATADLVVTMSRHRTGPRSPEPRRINSTGSWTSPVMIWRRCEPSAPRWIIACRRSSPASIRRAADGGGFTGSATHLGA